MADQQRCELCGSAVRVVGGNEGTMHYEPLPDPRIELAERLIVAASAFLAVYHAAAGPESGLGVDKAEGYSARNTATERLIEAIERAQG